MHEFYIKCTLAQQLGMFSSGARGVLFNASSPIRYKCELSGGGAGKVDYHGPISGLHVSSHKGGRGNWRRKSLVTKLLLNLF